MITEALMKQGREAAVKAAKAVDMAKQLVDPSLAGDQSDKAYVVRVADFAFQASLDANANLGLTNDDHFALGMAELFFFPINCLGKYTETDLEAVIALLDALTKTVAPPPAETNP